MIYALYEVATGEITGWGSCFELAHVDVPPGMQIIELESPVANTTHYVSGGAVVAYTPQQATAKGGIPPRQHLWSNALMAWVDQRSLNDLKRDKWADIKAEAAARDLAPITVATREFQTDDATRALMFQKMAIAREAIADGQPFSVDWPLDDDTVINLNANQLKAVVRAIDNRSESLRATARGLRAQIVAAANAAAVAAISWP